MLVDLKEIGLEWEGMARIQLAQGRVQWRTRMPLGSAEVEECLGQQNIC
jgi:hypothetical protein